MAAADIDATRSAPIDDAHVEAPITLDEPAAKALGFFDQVGLWGNLGVSLLGFTGALFVLVPRADGSGLSLAAALLATFVGTALGASAVGLAAIPGARTGVPAMVLLRGLFGGRLSYLPTGLNIVQLLGWGTFEIVIIASAAHQLWPSMPQNGYVVIAGGITTALALRPLGVVRVLRKYVTAAVVIVVGYLFVQLLRHPIPAVAHSSWRDFWPAVDVALAVAISWMPVASDYSRHSTSPRTAFTAAFVGYTVTQTACYALGIVAILSVPAAFDGSNHGVWGAFIAVFLGKAAFAVLAIREIDQSFCDVYSTAVSTQNLRPQWDRRVLALVIGAAATLLALLFHIGNYQNFLFLIGSVFVPLFGVLVVDYFVLRGDREWDVAELAPTRWLMLLPWAVGFCVYQLVNPGAIPRWAGLWTRVARDIHFTAQTWMSASLLSFVAAAALTVVVRVADRRPATRRQQLSSTAS
jgi:nucleobase:cation symporter-1, NCS1 family